jgi:hypothetical protein
VSDSWVPSPRHPRATPPARETLFDSILRRLDAIDAAHRGSTTACQFETRRLTREIRQALNVIEAHQEPR